MEDASIDRIPGNTNDIIQLKDHFYVLATSSLADQRTRALRHGESFGIFDVYGNVQPIGKGYQGLYDGSTRYLSRYELLLDQSDLLLLGSTVRTDNLIFTADLMNQNSKTFDDSPRPTSLHILRTKFIWNREFFERVKITNYGLVPIRANLTMRFKCDFADIFEIRGCQRSTRGTFLDPVIEDDQVKIAYQGADGILRTTCLTFSPKPRELRAQEAHFEIALAPKESTYLFSTVSLDTPITTSSTMYLRSFMKVAREKKVCREGNCPVETSNPHFNEWVQRSQADLHMMLTKTENGLYPYAGIPLFNTIFGRDGLFTALQTLWVTPSIAHGVLAYLAANQATEVDARSDAEPGKILHEIRRGEMVNTGDVPFRRYFGSVDSTPLFLLLAGKYFFRTGDREFLDSLWPHLMAAVDWLDKFGDRDKDGYVEYQRQAESGLANQGWKDSDDSVFHSDGTLAKGPIALCEVQGYVYEAKLLLAKLAAVRNEPELAEHWRQEALRLKERFNRDYWVPELNTYAIALDGEKRPCRVSSSNPGHCLYTGIVDQDKAHLVARNLMSKAMFSGWGIRTISTQERRYNPMSYHNGSLWPHDNSLIVSGFARYGMRAEKLRLSQALFEAAVFLDQKRLPELFCGFEKRAGEGPTLYPSACAPQSWASAAVFLTLEALLGMELQPEPQMVTLYHPVLPKFLDHLTLRRLRVGGTSADLTLHRHGDDVSVSVLRKDGPLEIRLIK